MIEELQLPPERDLAPQKLARLNDRLMHRIGREPVLPIPRQFRLAARHPSSGVRRRTIVVGCAGLALSLALMTTPALGIRSGLLRTLGVEGPAAPRVIHPAPPEVAVPSLESDWRSEISTRAHDYPEARFENPPEDILRARLAQAAREFGFRVESLEFVGPAQAAPLVIVQSNDPPKLASSMINILRLIDPKSRTGDDRTGWTYEGFFFEARDSNDVPFLVTFNYWRGPHAGGGQWARSTDLFPFQHL